MSKVLLEILKYIAEGRYPRFVFSFVLAWLTLRVIKPDILMASKAVGTGVVSYIWLVDFVVLTGAYTLILLMCGFLVRRITVFFKGQRLLKYNERLVNDFLRVAPSLNVHHTNTLYSLLSNPALPSYGLNEVESLIRRNYIVEVSGGQCPMFAINPAIRGEVANFLASIGKRSLEAAV